MDISIKRHALRLGGGIALPMIVGEALGWSAPFLASVFALQLLAVPTPPPTLPVALVTVLALGAAFLAAILLTAIVLPIPLLFVLGVGAAVFGGLYGQARTGSPFWFILLLAVTATPVLAAQAETLATSFAGIAVQAMIVALATAWLMHAAFPHPVQAVPSNAPPPVMDSRAAARKALLGTLIVMPLVLWLLANDSAAVVVAVTALTILQASSGQGRGRAAQGLLAANVIAGAIAIAAYCVITVAPTLGVLALVVLAVSLAFGGVIAMGGERAPLAMAACAAAVVLLGFGLTPFNDSATAFVARLGNVLLASAYTVAGVTILERLLRR